jgi:hypothetical protein
MKENTGKYLLWTLLIVVFALKLFLVLQSPYPTYESYYGVRYSEYVKEKFVPMIYDEFSYQGRFTIHNMPFYFFSSLLTFIIPIIFLFKFTTIFLSLLLVFLIYKLVYKLFENPQVAILVSLISVSVPTLFTYYANSFSPKSLFLIFFLFLLNSFFDLEQEKNIKWFLISFIAITLITPYSLILILGFLVYFLLLKIESLPIKKSTIEVLFFSLLFSFWYHLIIYKTALQKYGLSILWQNIPTDLINLSYADLNPIAAILLVGIVPVTLGLLGIYKTFFDKRKRMLILITSFAIVFLILLWLKVLPLYEGVMFLVLCFVILSSNSINSILEYFDKILFSKLKYSFTILIIIISVFNIFAAIALTNQTIKYSPTEDEFQTMRFITEKVPIDETILGDVVEGHFISYESQRKNFYDENFFLMNTAQQRFDDSKTIFLSKSKANVIELMSYYDIKYIYVSRLTRERYSASNLLVSNDDCFQKIFSTNTTEVYKRKCNI